jgi:hypothetical protein
MHYIIVCISYANCVHCTYGALRAPYTHYIIVCISYVFTAHMALSECHICIAQLCPFLVCSLHIRCSWGTIYIYALHHYVIYIIHSVYCTYGALGAPCMHYMIVCISYMHSVHCTYGALGAPCMHYMIVCISYMHSVHCTYGTLGAPCMHYSTLSRTAYSHIA